MEGVGGDAIYHRTNPHIVATHPLCVYCRTANFIIASSTKIVRVYRKGHTGVSSCAIISQVSEQKQVFDETATRFDKQECEGHCYQFPGTVRGSTDRLGCCSEIVQALCANVIF